MSDERSLFDRLASALRTWRRRLAWSDVAACDADVPERFAFVGASDARTIGRVAGEDVALVIVRSPEERQRVGTGARPEDDATDG